MPFHIDPKEPVRKEVDGITFLIRVLTQREMMRFAVISEAVATSARDSVPDASGQHTMTLTEKDVGHLERCLCLGVEGWEENDELPPFEAGSDGYMRVDLLDALPISYWMPLYAEITEANGATEDDEGK